MSFVTRPLTLLASLLILAPAAYSEAPATSEWTVRNHMPEAQFIIQSHRGAGELAPENTLEAFQLGWKLGTYPECDVRTTKDGHIVTFHDDNFSRVVKNIPNDMKKMGVADVTWEELSKMDVGAWRGEQFQGKRVVTIGEVFEQMTGRLDRHLYMDIKNVDFDQLAAEVKKHKVESQVVMASTKYDQIRQWKKLVPQSDTLHWMGGTEAALRKRIAELRKTDFADITQLQIHVHLKKNADLSAKEPFTPSTAFLREVGDELHAHHIVFQVLPYGGTEAKVYWRLLDLGVMSFATDRPDVTKEAVHRYYAGDTK
jgi:glycerophosphoryl diester phosphodiesterase